MFDEDAPIATKSQVYVFDEDAPILVKHKEPIEEKTITPSPESTPDAGVVAMPLTNTIVTEKEPAAEEVSASIPTIPAPAPSPAPVPTPTPAPEMATTTITEINSSEEANTTETTDQKTDTRSLIDKLVDKNWKIRNEAYETMRKDMQQCAEICTTQWYMEYAASLIKMTSDSNANSLDSGMETAIAFVASAPDTVSIQYAEVRACRSYYPLYTMLSVIHHAIPYTSYYLLYTILSLIHHRNSTAMQ